jgi:hypothetical protein
MRRAAIWSGVSAAVAAFMRGVSMLSHVRLSFGTLLVHAGLRMEASWGPSAHAGADTCNRTFVGDRTRGPDVMTQCDSDD